ncbi:hypothetical protein [Streptomyces bacillaris]|uniref:Uncharacterized protein n=1 Tax=Streptomyces bacillaris TaxID=68179 RepID=A0ABW6E1H6_9ACTN
MVPPQGVRLGGRRRCAAAGDVAARRTPRTAEARAVPDPLHAHPARRINGAHVQEHMCD